MMLWSRSSSLASLGGRPGNLRATITVRIFFAGLVGFLLIYFFGRYSAFETFSLISRTVLLDNWLVPGSMSCSHIQFIESNFAQENNRRNFQVEWDKHFNSPDVISWRRDYLSQCSNKEKTISAVLSAGQLTSPGLGLGSNTNFALNLFLLSNECILEPRKFQLYIVNWNYVSWSLLFQDFSANSTCPIVHTLDDVAFAQINRSAEIMNFQLVNGNHVDFGPLPHLIREINSDGYVKFFKNIVRLESMMGKEKAFRRKSLVARGFLQLQPQLKNIIQTIWSQLVDSHGSYSVVHIRRGDKTENGESVAFPILLYYRALRRLCLAHPGSCSRNVYVFCDDPQSCREFKSLAKNCFQVTDFRQHVERAKILPFFDQSSVNFKTQTQFNQLPDTDRLASAQEILISIYLAALSDFFVCTYSSNICRLVALLKNGDINDLNILSLDWPNWTMI